MFQDVLPRQFPEVTTINIFPEELDGVSK